MLRSTKGRSRKLGFAVPNISAEDAIALFEQQEGLCVGCSKPINLLEPRSSFLDHDHTTGVVRGYLCNTVEGFLKNYTDAQVLQLVKFIRQHNSL